MSLKIGQTFNKVDFTLGSLTLADDWSGSKIYPNLVETKQISESGDVVENDVNAYALHVDFESNQEFKISPFKIKIITTKTLFIVANLSFIKEI